MRLTKEVTHDIFWFGKLFVVLDFLNEGEKSSKPSFSVVLKTRLPSTPDKRAAAPRVIPACPSINILSLLL